MDFLQNLRHAKSEADMHPAYMAVDHFDRVASFYLSLSRRARNVLSDNDLMCPFAIAQFFSANGEDAMLALPRCGRRTQREIQDAAFMFLHGFIAKSGWGDKYRQS